jgi:toxin YoeB
MGTKRKTAIQDHVYRRIRGHDLMKVSFFNQAVFNSFYEWTIKDKKVAKKIAALIRDIERNPAAGIGKSEPLKYQYAGFYSRRITQEHRLVYKIIDDSIVIISCEGHYE